MDCKGIAIDDKDITFVKLSSGTYLVDGEIVKCDNYLTNRVQCKNPNDIRIVTFHKDLVEYHCGDTKMTVAEYNDWLYKLKAECVKTEYDDYTEYNNLEDEFKYRKFVDEWKPVYVTNQYISDPIKVEIEHIQYDTGSKYIRSTFLNGTDNDETLYSYYQAEAWLDFVKECFDELGMEFERGLSYNQTANKKVWSNPDHGCIEFVVAFGTYILSDRFKNPRVIKGTLQDVKERLENDKKAIRSIIISGYKKHFGDIDAGRFDFDTLSKKLNNAMSYLNEVSPKAKTSSQYYSCMKNLREAINQISSAYECEVKV